MTVTVVIKISVNPARYCLLDDISTLNHRNILALIVIHWENQIAYTNKMQFLVSICVILTIYSIWNVKYPQNAFEFRFHSVFASFLHGSHSVYAPVPLNCVFHLKITMHRKLTKWDRQSPLVSWCNLIKCRSSILFTERPCSYGWLFNIHSENIGSSVCFPK